MNSRRTPMLAEEVQELSSDERIYHGYGTFAEPYEDTTGEGCDWFEFISDAILSLNATNNEH